MTSIEFNIRKLKKYTYRISNTKSIKCSALKPKTLPPKKGIYMFLDKNKKIFYVGSCGVEGKGGGTLRSRVYSNHIRGNVNSSSFMKRVGKNYIRKNLNLKYIEIEDKELINNIGHFMIAIFEPKYND